MTALKAGVAAAAAFIGAKIVSGLGKAAFSMAELAGQGQALAGAFDNLAAAAGESSDKILAALRRGTGGTVSNFKLMQEANRALISGLPASADKMEELATVARGLGQAVGIDATEAFQRMVRGISKQEIELLDELFGGAVKFKDILKALGPAATATAKQQAIYNSILKVGKERVAAMGGITETFSDRMSRARAKIENLQEGIGRLLIPMLDKLIPVVDAVSISIQRMFDIDVSGRTGLSKSIADTERQLARLGRQRHIVQTSTHIQYTRGRGRTGLGSIDDEMGGRGRALEIIEDEMEDLRSTIQALKLLQESQRNIRLAPKRAEEALVARIKGQQIEAPEFKMKTDPERQAARAEKFQDELFKLNYERGKALDKEREITVSLLDETKDTNEVLRDLSLIFDARMNKLIDSGFKMQRAIQRLNIGGLGDAFPQFAAFGKTFSQAANVALAASAGFQAASAGFGIIKSLFGSGSALPVGSLSNEELRREARQIGNYVAGASVPQWAIDKRQAEIEAELQRRQEEGTRTFGGASTFTETTGRELVAATNSVLSELQFGHLRNIEEMLAEGIPVRTIGLATKLATDTTSTRRSAGL